MRGKGFGGVGSIAFFRFIPAYAGKRPPQTLRAICNEIHPRVCGEKNGTESISQGKADSSPHMRGKVPGHPLPTPLRKIHPRVCGEKCCVYSIQSHNRRFIPAYAGKRLYCCTLWRFVWIHPRVCGEKAAAARSVPGSADSSPRMRGKDNRADSAVYADRFIPAYAVKRLSVYAVFKLL